jgi:hypothetical protein
MRGGVKAVFEECQVQKSEVMGNFVRIAGAIAIVSLISMVVAASFIYRNDVVSAKRDRNARQRAEIGSLSMSRRNLDGMKILTVL